MSIEDLEKVKQEISKAEDRIRYYEQQDKIMRSEIQRLTRKERTHRLCTRGGLVEHFILEPDLLTDADVYILLSSLFESEETQEKLKVLIEHRKEVNESSLPCGDRKAHSFRCGSFSPQSLDDFVGAPARCFALFEDSCRGSMEKKSPSQGRLRSPCAAARLPHLRRKEA